MKFWITRILSIVGAIVGCLALEAVALKFTGDYTQRLIVLAALYVTLAVSLNLINGITGQFSIGHAAFYQIGAYLGAYLTVNRYLVGDPALGNQHPILPAIPWLFLMMLAGACGAAAAGFVVGLPSLRLKGDYLAIVTLGFGEIIRIQVQNTQALGGAYGMNVAPKVQHIWIVALLAVFCIAVCRNLLKTAHGLPFLAVREDEIASSAMGVNVTKVKVTAFIIGSAFAGAAGAYLAHFEGFITPATFSMDVSFIILTMVVLGGTGSITGSAVSAIFLSYLPEYLRGLRNPDGNPLSVSGASVIAALVATAIAVSIVKPVLDTGSGTPQKRLGIYLGAIALAFVAKLAVQAGLARFPSLNQATIEAGQLRMVIFAVTLVVVMLLRPQGVFAHHEFSWTWVKKIFSRERKSAVPS